ncbi:hypothetical protein Syn6312_1984 [Synechococcus sp. PCC 6312]|nr:hypothetical protein Syn6312_1984 [Synechococcus sp. PCC 6312]
MKRFAICSLVSPMTLIPTAVRAEIPATVSTQP